MAACTLDVGSRRVLVSDEGPPAAEFVLFDASDIELAPNDAGVLREAGYRTTAGDASRRLAVAGVTLEFAAECATLVRGRIAATYARSPLIQRLAPILGPAELFDGGTYDATLRRYEGTWVDLPLLANDAGIASSTGVLHAAALAALLGEVASDTPVVLTTLGHSESLRLGERTLRRHAIDNIASVPRALRHLAELAPAPSSSGQGPGRDVFGTMLKARLAACVNVEARDHLAKLERALAERGRPSHGPLSDSSMWEIERLLGAGDHGSAQRRIEAREASHGRDPTTVYLRARLALIQGRESPRAIALRVAEMAQSMPDFHELELLAAQAWNAAGETRNALPFARDLATNPRVSDELRAAAEAILRSPRVPPPGEGGDRDFDASDLELASVSLGTSPGAPISERPTPVEPATPAILVAAEAGASPSARSVPPPQVVVHDLRNELPFSRTPTDPPPRPRTLTPPSFTPKSIPPVAMSEARRYLTPPERIASPLPPRQGTSASPARRPEPSSPPTPRSPGTLPPPIPKRAESEPPPTPRPMSKRTPSEAPETPRPGARVVQPASWPTALRAPREENARPEDIEHTPARAASQRFMRGASLPPLVSLPSAGIPRPPVVPRVDIDEPDLIETLPLPLGAADTAVDPGVIPRSPIEARVRFTMDARELAKRYRHEDGIELRLETRTVQAMQRRLAQRFAHRTVSTPEEAREAELHGALLSELFARLLDAEWTDISPSELGYWAMVVTARGGEEKRVWPFGRVLRFIASGGEDDLVAFFKKLREPV